MIISSSGQILIEVNIDTIAKVKKQKAKAECHDQKLYCCSCLQTQQLISYFLHFRNSIWSENSSDNPGISLSWAKGDIMNTGRAPALLTQARRGHFTAAAQSIQAWRWESFLPPLPRAWHSRFSPGLERLMYSDNNSQWNSSKAQCCVSYKCRLQFPWEEWQQRKFTWYFP